MSRKNFVSLDIKGMDKIKKEVSRLGGNFPVIADKAIKLAAQNTKKNVRQKTTALFRQRPQEARLRKTKKSVVWRIGFNKKFWYLKFFESGTKRHVIKGKPRLAIRGKYGKVYFVRRVRHPGQKAQPFMVREIIKPLKAKKEKIIAKELWRQVKAMK